MRVILPVKVPTEKHPPLQYPLRSDMGEAQRRLAARMRRSRLGATCARKETATRAARLWWNQLKRRG